MFYLTTTTQKVNSFFVYRDFQLKVIFSATESYDDIRFQKVFKINKLFLVSKKLQFFISLKIQSGSPMT